MKANQSSVRNEVTRRTFLRASLASAMLAAGGPAFAQLPAPAQQERRVKRPAVWLDMDQAELDAAYDQIKYAPNLPQIIKRYATNSEAVRARLGAPRRYAYGPTPIEALDVYATKRANAPINIFIHGGAWRGGLAKDSGYPAELFVHAGAHYVVPDFINVVEASGNLAPMAEQVRRAVAWVYRNAQSFGGDPNRIYVSGHSSGGHLAGVVLVTDWRKDFNLPVDTVKGGLCCSGMFDLKPVRLSARSSYVKFTDEIEQAEFAASSRQAERPCHRRLRHTRDARVPTPVARFRCCGEDSRQTRAAPRRRGLQPLRDPGDSRESLRSSGACGIGADEPGPSMIGVTGTQAQTGAVRATDNAGQQGMAAFAQITAVAPEERIESIDVVRGIALFGVLIVNLITEFRVSIFQQFLGTTSAQTSADRVVERIVSLGFEAKAFCLFALLFGVGLAIQYDRLCRHGTPLYWLFRRLVVLLVFGLLHLLLIWNGDILTEYALAGLVALPLLLMRTRGLLVASAGFLALYAAGPALLYSNLWPDTAALQHHVALANQVYPSGSFVEVWRFSLQELQLLLPLHIFAFPRTLALFLLGAWLWRADVLKRPQDFRRQTIAAAVVGIVGGAALAAADTHGFLTNARASTAFLIAFTPVLLALGYGAAIIALLQLSVAQRLLSAFAPAGRMAFTNYVLQSVIFGFIFFGYGLGQFGGMGAATALVVGVAVYIAQMVLSKWWLGHYRFGPIEWLWRTLMYGVAQPLRKPR